MTVGAEDSCHEVLGRYEPTSDRDPAELAFVIEGRGRGLGISSSLFSWPNHV